MTDKELKEAVESLSNLADHCHIVNMFEAEKLLRKQIIPFLNIYLSMEGFPEEKKRDFGAKKLNNEPLTESDVLEDYRRFGYNQVLKDCKLVLMKKFSVENLITIIRDTIVDKYNGHLDIGSDVTELAKSIHKLLEEK